MLRKKLIDGVLEKTWLTEDDVKIMRKNECFASEIKLALALYHCCGTNPKTHVYNNESLIHDTTGVRERIKKHFQKPCSPTIALEANDKVNG